MGKLFQTSLAGLLVLSGVHAQEWSQAGEPDVYFRFAGAAQVSFIGVNLADIDNDRAHALKLRDVHGVEITRVEDNSPAAKAGLKPGDVVLDYNGQRVEGMEQFGRFVRETPAGREVKLSISRDGNQMTVPVTIGAHAWHSPDISGMQMPPLKEFQFNMPDIKIPDMPQVFENMRTPILGVEAEALTPQLAEFFGVKDGVLVRSVFKDSAAEKAGLKAGDVITKVEQEPVTSASELTGALRSARSKTTFPLQIVRDRREMTVTVTIDKAHTGGMTPSRVRVVDTQSLKM